MPAMPTPSTGRPGMPTPSSTTLASIRSSPIETLTRAQLSARLFLVPFGSVQQQVVLNVPPPLRVIIYRRLMVRIAEAIAVRHGALALVTGDVVGQVASQTLENIAAINRVATMPVLRPLIGDDKEEITAMARAIGTYETSIIPDEDCCTLFTPRHPSTRAKRWQVDAAERDLPIDEMVEAAAAAPVIERVDWPVVKSPAAV